jgi:hypothetical protein
MAVLSNGKTGYLKQVFIKKMYQNLSFAKRWLFIYMKKRFETLNLILAKIIQI